MGNIGNYRGVSFNKKVTPFVLLGVFKESWRLVFDDKLPLFTKKDVVLLGKILKHYKKEIAVQYVVDVVLDWNKLRIRFPKLYGKPNVGVLFGWRGVFMEYIDELKNGSSGTPNVVERHNRKSITEKYLNS